MLLKTLRLSNLFGFQDFTLELEQFTVLAGLNNAGKTSILKIIPFAIDCIRDGAPGFIRSPKDTRNPGSHNLNLQQIAFRHFQDGEPSNLKFRPSGNNEAVIALTFETPEGIAEFTLQITGMSNCHLLFTVGGTEADKIDPTIIRNLLTKLSLLRPEFIPPVSEIPPEPTIDWNTVESSVANGKYAQTFRNRFHWAAEGAEPGVLDRVIDRIKRSLPRVRLNPPRRTRGQGTYVDVSFNELGFDYDIGLGGAGLRTLVVLAAAIELSQATVLLIDEPDAHLNPGAQRDVALFLAEQAIGDRQIIVTTHAPDFIDMVSVDSLIWIDRNQRGGTRCDDTARMLIDLGAISKHDALPFSGGDAVLFFEGLKDRRFFAELMKKCGMASLWQRCRVEPLGGHGDGRHVSPAIRFLKALIKRKLAVVVLRDADYLNLEPKIVATEDDNVLDIRLPYKELENLFLTPELIETAARMEADRRQERSENAVPSPSRDEIAEKLDEYSSSEGFRKIVERQWLYRWINEKGLKDPGKLTEAYDAFEAVWKNPAWRRRCCPGKELLKKLRAWLQIHYKLTLANSLLLDAYQPDPELKQIFARIEQYVVRMTA